MDFRSILEGSPCGLGEWRASERVQDMVGGRVWGGGLQGRLEVGSRDVA